MKEYSQPVLRRHAHLRQVTFSGGDQRESGGDKREDVVEVKAPKGGTPIVNAVLEGELDENSYQKKLTEAGHKKSKAQMKIIRPDSGNG